MEVEAGDEVELMMSQGSDNQVRVGELIQWTAAEFEMAKLIDAGDGILEGEGPLGEEMMWYQDEQVEMMMRREVVKEEEQLGRSEEVV